MHVASVPDIEPGLFSGVLCVRRPEELPISVDLLSVLARSWEQLDRRYRVATHLEVGAVLAELGDDPRKTTDCLSLDTGRYLVDLRKTT